MISSENRSEPSSSLKNEVVKFAFTNESALEYVLQSPLAIHVESIKDSNWKVRLEGMHIYFYFYSSESHV